MVTALHPIGDAEFASECRDRLDNDGALILRGFFTPEAVEQAAGEAARLDASAFYSNAIHNVYLTATDPSLPDGHPFNRSVVSNKGLIANDLIAADLEVPRIDGHRL